MAEESQENTAAPQTPANRKISFHLSRWMPWLFIGVILILVYFGVKDIVVLAADAQGSATLTAAELKDRVDELKWILTLIVTTAGLFTVAQGIAAGFNAQNFTKQAETSLSQLDRNAQTFTDQAKGRLGELKKFEDEVRARYTIYSQLADLWSNAFGNITLILQSDSPVQNPDEGFHWRRGFYEKLPLRARQELISAEQIVPYEIAGKGEPDATYVLKLRRLARFYWSKFIYERSRGAGSLADLEHAEHLLNLATRKIGSVFYLLNDMGNIHIEHFRAFSKALPAAERTEVDEAELKRILDCARQCFKDSIATRKQQLRAYFDLAFVEADLGSTPATTDQNLLIAIGHLREGMRYPNWEHEPVEEFRCQALYNLACFYARRATGKKLMEQACICVLRKVAKLGLASPDDVARDFNTEKGDFYPLLNTGTVQPAVKTLLRKLQKELAKNSK